MKKPHSCFGRGQGVVNQNDRQSPLAPFPCRSAPRLYNRVAEALRPRHWRFVVTPTARDFMHVNLNKS